MPAESIAAEFAAQQGWTETTLLDLALTYIDRQGDDDAFADYLRSVAEEESGPTACLICGGPVETRDGVSYCADDCQNPEEDDTADRYGVGDAYPNGRCQACGSGMDEQGRCYQSECSQFDESSPFAGYDEN